MFGKKYSNVPISIYICYGFLLKIRIFNCSIFGWLIEQVEDDYKLIIRK
jgi:hypothetical protein